jgi:outer membrane protein assembly factor BamB
MTEYVVKSDSADDEQALVEKMAAQDRAMLDSQDVRSGGSIHSIAVVWENSVLSLVMFGSADKYFYALDKRTGRLVWKYLTGDSIGSSPCADNERVFFGSYDGYVYALRAEDGKLAWKFKTGDVVFSSPTVARGVVYVGSMNGYVYALQAETGALLWQFRTGQAVNESPRVMGDTVFVGSNDWHVYALDAKSGALKWSFRATGIPTEPVIALQSGKVLTKLNSTHIEKSENGIVCFGTWGSKYVFVLDVQNGRLLHRNSMMWDVPSQPNFHNGVMYCGTADKYVYAIEPRSGHVVWRFSTNGMVSSSPCISDGVVYIGSYDQHLYAIDEKSGEPLWKFRTDGVITSSPRMESGVLYFGSWDTHFYAIDTLKRELIWKFKVSAPPCKPSFMETISSLSRIRTKVLRWWQPEKPRITVYETQTRIPSSGIGVGPYKSSEPYASHTKYETPGPAGYAMRGQEKKRDWRDQFAKR